MDFRFRIIIGLVTVLVASLSVVILARAGQVEIPAKYRGEWCDHISGNYFTRYHPGMCQRRGIGYMRITSAGYEHVMEDSERCRIIRVKTNVPSDQRTQFYGADHLMTFVCDIDGAEDPQSLTLWFGTTPGKKGRGIRLHIEPLDDDQKDK